MSDRLAWVAFVVMFGIVIAVADMNWPSHMGEQGALMDTLWGLLTSDYIPNKPGKVTEKQSTFP